MQRRFQTWLSDNPDEAILRWIFRSVVMVTIAVLAIDLAGMNGWGAYADLAAAPAEIKQDSPALDHPGSMPSILAPLLPGGDKRLMPLPQPDGAMARPMTFELVSGGKLMATGTITPGSSQSFAAEVGKRGDYVKTVVLNSPGGSVTDALAMGRLIRERKFATEVEAGKYCASSCPLVFAGGVERRAGEKAAIGVHQVFSPTDNPAANNMDQAQRISADCQKYLVEMGVDPRLWIHAMETPRGELYHLKPDELLSLKLATQRGEQKSAAAVSASGS